MMVSGDTSKYANKNTNKEAGCTPCTYDIHMDTRLNDAKKGMEVETEPEWNETTTNPTS